MSSVELPQRGGDYIRALVSGYPSAARAEKLLVSIQAYIDDSRSDFGDQRMVLAGYINTAANWMRFSDAWYAELRSAPSIDYLKMKEAYGLNGQFGGWDKKDRDQKLENLARIIRHFKPVSIHSSVSRKQISEIIKPVAPYGLSGAYFHCFGAILIPIAIHQSKERGLLQVPIDFIFDEQEGEGDEARQIYKIIRQQQPAKVQKVLSLEPIFQDDKLVMPLQAADMLAWHIRRQFEDGAPEASKPPSLLMADGATHMSADIDEAYLRRVAAGFAAIPGAAGLADKNGWKKYRRKMKALGLPVSVSPAFFRRKYMFDRIRKFLAGLINR